MNEQTRRQETRKASRTRMVVDIHTWIDDLAPASHRWMACIGEYDEGTKVFSGRTQREAIDDLLDYHEQDNGELLA